MNLYNRCLPIAIAFIWPYLVPAKAQVTFQKLYVKNTANTLLHNISSTQSSAEKCVLLCYHHQASCQSYDYRKSDGMCILHVISGDPEFDHYEAQTNDILGSCSIVLMGQHLAIPSGHTLALPLDPEDHPFDFDCDTDEKITVDDSTGQTEILMDSGAGLVDTANFICNDGQIRIQFIFDVAVEHPTGFPTEGMAFVGPIFVSGCVI